MSKYRESSADELKRLIKSSEIWEKHSSMIDLVDQGYHYMVQFIALILLYRC